MKFNPLHDHIVINLGGVTEDKTNESGFIVELGRVEHERGRTNSGTVIAVGEGRYTDQGVFIPTVCHVDDIVRYVPGAAKFNMVDPETGDFLVFVEERDIMLIEAD